MTADWLVVMSEDNWQICEREELISVGGDGSKLDRFEYGDRLWIYVNRKYVDHQVPHVYEIQALARVSGPVMTLKKSPWRKRGRSEYKLARAIAVERRLRISALQLVKSLSFAGTPPVWGLSLLNAPLRLTPNDVKNLERAAAKA